MNKKLKALISVLLVIAILFSGCALTGCTEIHNNMNVERNIMRDANRLGINSKELSQWEGRLELHNFGSYYVFFDIKNHVPVYYINVQVDLNEDPAKDFTFEESEKTLDSQYLEMLEDAKSLVCQYIDSSDAIKADDKEELKRNINEVTVHYGTRTDEDVVESDVIINTIGTELYFMEGNESYYTVGTILHELVHVASNVTNIGSKNQFALYRFSYINEALTELITREILSEANREEEIFECVYEMFFPFVYTLLKKVDFLEAYFYADKYDPLYEELGKNWVDMYYMAVEWGSMEDLFVKEVPYWAFAQFK